MIQLHDVYESINIIDFGSIWVDGRITELDLSNRSLNGNIPHNIGDLTELTFIGLSGNNLTGDFPESICNLVNLEYLNLNFTDISCGSFVSGKIFPPNIDLQFSKNAKT